MTIQVLKNRTYIGEITFQGKQYKGIHQRLIDDEVFYKAQDILKARSVTKQASSYLLSSLVFCGNCGAKMRYMKWDRARINGGNSFVIPDTTTGKVRI